MVHELTEKYAEVAGAFPLVVATGGDAALLFKDDERVDRVVPDLVLAGIHPGVEDDGRGGGAR